MFSNNLLMAAGGGADASLPVITDTLLAHYRADLGVTKDESNLVSVWADQSDNGYDLLQDTAGDLPTWVASGIGGKNTIRGDGTGTFMNAVFTKAQPYHLFVIINQISWSGSPTSVIVGGIINDTHPAFIQRTSSPQIQQNAGTATGNAISPALGVDSLIHGYWSGANSYLVLDTGAQQGATNPGTIGITALTVFGKDDSHYANVDIAEICLYATEVDGDDLTTLQDYFNLRYTLGF
jgi:hypothetical protein|tara:strand:+ start:15 stop:725 length:711 start_codon:yes stop_codon:yes gene_type:complete